MALPNETTAANQDETTRATAHLPGLEIEIVHRRAADETHEQISINVTAVPSFEAFGRYLEAANPFALWADLVRLAWSPWLSAARMPLPGWSPPSLLDTPRSDGDRRA